MFHQCALLRIVIFTITDQPNISSYNLESKQTVDLLGQKYVTNTNLEPDYKVQGVNLLEKRKNDESCIKVKEEDAKTQSDSGHIEHNSPFIKNVKKEKAMEVCQTPDQMRNILASGKIEMLLSCRKILYAQILVLHSICSKNYLIA